jgi:hypothetical protein
LAKPADAFPLRKLAEDRAFDRWLRCEAIRQLAGARTRRVVRLMRLLGDRAADSMPPPPDNPNQQEVMAIRFRQARTWPGPRL